MMPAWMIALGVSMGISRLASLYRFWRLPHKQGPQWCFTTEVGPSFYQGEGRSLLREFHLALLLPFAVDAVIVPLLWIAGLAHAILTEQVLMFVLNALFANLLIVHFSMRARTSAGVVEPPPVTATQLMLEPRRLRDQTRLWVELLIAGFTITGLALLPGPFVYGAAWLLYVGLGFLMLKVAFVHWRMKLPLRRTEEYRRWRTAWLAYHMKIFDAARLLVASAMPAVALQSAWAWSVVAAAGVGFVWFSSREHARIKVVAREVRPFTLAREFPLSPVPEGRFHAGGLVYFNRDLPMAVVRGPRGLALNFAHRSTVLSLAYISGLAVLMFLRPR